MHCVDLGNRIENAQSTIVQPGQSFNMYSSEIHFVKNCSAHYHIASDTDQLSYNLIG